MNQHRLLHETEWDNLLILDAQRFDYFKKLYPAYLKGKLIQTQTNSSCTETWLANNWQRQYDLTYISGNPYVNSAGVPIRKYDENPDAILNGYTAKTHFKEIIDVWDYYWNDEFNTVMPEAINNAIREHTNGKNFIAHYVQPHWPYIGKTRMPTGSGIRLRSNIHRGLYNKKALKKFTPTKDPKSAAHMQKVRQCYADNVRAVLEGVADIVPYLKGTTIISADHGELLGEDGYYNHPCRFKHPLLRLVPWFTVGGKR